MKSSLTLLALLSSTSIVHSAVTILPVDFTNAGNIGGPLDDAGVTTSVTLSDVTFSVSTTTNFGDGTSVFNASASQAGVNTGGGGSSIGDSAAQTDPGETLTFTLTFGPAISAVGLSSLDFGGLGDATDSATVTYPDGLGGTTTVTLDQNSSNVDSNDTWTPSPGIVFMSGDSITFSNVSAGSFSIDTAEFTITTIPEPSGLVLLSIAGLAVLRRRR